MAFAILGNPKPAFFDSSGAPLVSGTLSVLDPADDTNKASYATYDEAEVPENPNPNPITLDSRGECDLWGLDGEDYKLVLKDSNGNTIWTTDDVFLPSAAIDRQYEDVVLDHGAVGDGIADDTAAIQAAIDTRNPVYVPAGTYLVTSLDYGSPAGASQADIWGDGKTQTFIKTSGAGPVMQFGSTSMTGFIGKVVIRGISFEGLDNSTTTEAVLCYGMAECLFDDCAFYSAQTGLYDYGGISNTYNNCNFGTTAKGSQIGIRFNNEATLFYTGDSNNCTISNSNIKNNTKWGIHFDYGRLLNVLNCDIETNGQTALGADYGGIYVGSNAGARVTAYETALHCKNTWFEGNIGKAEIWLNGGFNVIEECYMRTSAASVTSDIIIDRGQYTLKNLLCSVSKTANVDETVSANVQAGNIIMGGVVPTFTIDEAKTTIFGERTETNNFQGATKFTEASSGATAAVDVDAMVLESSGRTGFTILSGTANEGRVVFGSSDDVDAGWLEYNHSTDDMLARAGGGNRLLIRGSGGIGVSNTTVNVNTPSGATAKQMAIYDTSGSLLGYIPIYGAAW